MNKITDTQPLHRHAEPAPRRPFDYRRRTRALQVTAACLGLAVVGEVLGIVLVQSGPVASQAAEQLAPLGTVTPETTTTTTAAAAGVTSTAAAPTPVVQPARATTVRQVPVQPIQPLRSVPVVTSTAPPPQVVIVVPAAPPVETAVPTVTRSRRAAPPPRESQSRAREPYEPQDPPLIDIGGLLPP
jgi:hypothetical protein